MAVQAGQREHAAQLEEKYREVIGEQSQSNHKQFLFRRIAWRIRTPKNLLREPIDDGRTIEARLRPSLDLRPPLPGTPLIRRIQGKDIIVGNTALPAPHRRLSTGQGCEKL